ncbi:hypothetical protein CEXT_731791 [Caerostris extrusa]|uniref:Uncharacterized protein n=1 Tax=Caerostris extrusa TaxID=172846 RepID=A0AAV4NAZ5_CAEEX|nr:hypothetical protein CEXT_731791 [Caerostris extrusa]
MGINSVASPTDEVPTSVVSLEERNGHHSILNPNRNWESVFYASREPQTSETSKRRKGIRITESTNAITSVEQHDIKPGGLDEVPFSVEELEERNGHHSILNPNRNWESVFHSLQGTVSGGMNAPVEKRDKCLSK